MTNRRSFYGGRGDDIRVLDVEFQSQTAEETMQPIRYIAVTCEPDDFVLSGNSLRHYGGGTELFIAMTMCNESEDIFSGTMNSCVPDPHQSAWISTEPNPQNYEERGSPLHSQRIQNLGRGRLEESRRLHYF